MKYIFVANSILLIIGSEKYINSTCSYMVSNSLIFKDLFFDML